MAACDLGGLGHREGPPHALPPPDPHQTLLLQQYLGQSQPTQVRHTHILSVCIAHTGQSYKISYVCIVHRPEIVYKNLFCWYSMHCVYR